MELKWSLISTYIVHTYDHIELGFGFQRSSYNKNLQLIQQINAFGGAEIQTNVIFVFDF